jgi:hypothetical protein
MGFNSGFKGLIYSLTPYNTSFLTPQIQVISILLQQHISKHLGQWFVIGITCMILSAVWTQVNCMILSAVWTQVNCMHDRSPAVASHARYLNSIYLLTCANTGCAYKVKYSSLPVPSYRQWNLGKHYGEEWNQLTVRGLSGKYPAILNISKTGRVVTLM